MLLAALFGTAASEGPNGFGKARDLYYRGIYGDKSAGAQADGLFTRLYSHAPANPLVQVYYGSLRLLEAESTWALWKKNSLSKEGVGLMNQAVTQLPASLEVRFVRAATERKLPSYFGLKQQAVDDMSTIAKAAERAAKDGRFEPQLAAASFYYHGEDCAESSEPWEAVEAWRAAVRVAPESRAGRGAAEKLKQVR